LAYCAVADVKAVLDIAAAVVLYDTELTACIVSADALIDSLLESHDLSVPASVPQNVEDASAHYTAWLFRRRRDPKGASAFKLEAEVFLQAYIDSASELAFKVVNDQ
jgi:uncharacterized protein involved in tolerance to divalent cations